MAMPVIRAFIAIEISPLIHSGLNQTAETLKRQLGKLPVKWVPVGNIHLTLKFLGDVSTNNLESLEDMLRNQAASHPSFQIQIGELGVFPSIRRPNVIWIGVQAPSEMFDLQKGIDAEASHFGYPREERAFSPHLTLGRVARNASNEEARKIGELIGSMKIGSLGNQVVQSVNLYQSDLQPAGAIYTRLFTASLG
jgi:2'-5' RNA ligase